MNAQERILKTLNHEEPDRIPSFESSIDNLKIYDYYGEKYAFQGGASFQKTLYYFCFGSKKLLTKLIRTLGKGEKAAKAIVRNLVRFYKKIGLDLSIFPLVMFPYQIDKTGSIDEFGRRMDYKKNPSDGMDILYYMGGVIKDFEEYQAFPLPDPDDPMRENFFKATKTIQKEFNEEVYVMPGIGGLMEMTWEGFGLQNFSRLLARKKHAKQVFDDRGSFAVEMVKRIVEWGETGAVMLLDDYGYKKGLFMSPRNYKEFVFPWLKKICDTAHKGGIKVMLHSCGDIYDIFEDIIKCGVDAIHPVEPTTANPDYDIFKLNEKYGDQITFIGNVSPQDLADKDPDFVKELLKKLFKEVAPGGGYILSSGHSINPAIKLENFLAMRKTIEKYGRYPIKIE
ncbi:hypothetical protein ES705_08135 [subsurface metagenome]